MLALVLVCSLGALAQKTVIVHDPAMDAGDGKPPAGYEAIVTQEALPRVRAFVGKDACEEDVAFAGFADGAFTTAGADQTLVFYQFCQTGNGFGWNGLVLLEDGKIVGNFVSSGGWAVDIQIVPDINQNGLDEFTLAYSGGIHQGQGGTGVDLMEFSGGLPKGIGWYKAEEFGPTEAVTSWKLTAKPGKTPIFYKQKFLAGEGKKPKPVGRNTLTKLEAVFTEKFEVIK